MIPKSQDNDSFAVQEFRPRSIANLADIVVVPATVWFDRELCGRTVEIQDVTIQGMLTAKFVACKVALPQMAPKYALRIGCLFSQQTSAIHEELSLLTSLVSERNPPHLNPLPASGARRITARRLPSSVATLALIATSVMSWIKH